MSHKTKWRTISIAIYIIFVIVAVSLKLLTPARVGLSWSIFWYIAVAGFLYYFYFKNVAYQEVIYYARELHLSRSDLEAIVPDRKNTAEVPDPDHPNIFSPLVQVPLEIINKLTTDLEKRAKDAQVTPFK